MLFVIVGPSGSGKSTFIKLVLESIKTAEVINVDVCTPFSRLYEQSLGRTHIDIDNFKQKSQNAEYSIINSYDRNNYGYNIPTECNEKETVFLLDYPGEYPECSELQKYIWKGILILPPSEKILEQRLIKCSRKNRISSAVEEYKECLEDIKNHKLENWLVINNSSNDDLINGIKWIKNEINGG